MTIHLQMSRSTQATSSSVADHAGCPCLDLLDAHLLSASCRPGRPAAAMWLVCRWLHLHGPAFYAFALTHKTHHPAFAVQEEPAGSQQQHGIRRSKTWPACRPCTGADVPLLPAEVDGKGSSRSACSWLQWVACQDHRSCSAVALTLTILTCR